jgi:hypothetical protein
MSRENKVWLVTLVIWGIGVGAIALLWNQRVFVSDLAESVFGFILYIVAFFYFLAVMPIRSFVERHFFKRREPDRGN